MAEMTPEERARACTRRAAFDDIHADDVAEAEGIIAAHIREAEQAAAKKALLEMADFCDSPAVDGERPPTWRELGVLLRAKAGLRTRAEKGE